MTKSDKGLPITSKENERKTLPYLSEGIIIATAPVVSYTVAFVYEAGYTDHYQIPSSLISISLANILIALGYLIIFLLVLFVISDAIYRSFWLRTPEVIRRVAPKYFYGLLLLLASVLFKDFRIVTFFVVVMYALFLLTDFVIPVFLGKKDHGTTYLERVEKMHLADVHSPSIIDNLMKKSGPHVFLWFFILVAALQIAYMAGRGNAANQNEYWVFESDSSNVVLRIYDDLLIVGFRKGETSELEKRLKIVRMTDESGITLRKMNTGPLAVAKTPAVQSQTKIEVKKE